MSAPFGTVGPNQDLFEQRFRHLEQRVTALGQRDGGLITGDEAGGMARPWIPIVLYPRFAVAAGLFTAMSRAVDVTERVLWEGSIGYLSHPSIQVTGMWGSASGTNTTRYQLKVNSTVVGTWDVATAAAKDTRGPYSLLTVADIGDTDVPVELTAQTLSGAGDYACQPFSCHLRSTS